MPDVEVRQLTKRFGDFVAVAGLSFEVSHGEIFGLLGPNGAGKSTLLRMLTTLVPPTSGEARVNGHDVSAEIRTPEVSAQVSEVARVPAVREHLIARQRAIIAAAAPGIVAEGRDIGTVVATNAGLKVFLTADPGARARRRAAETRSDAGETEAAQARRDRLDAAQSEKAADALLLDATDLTLDEVIGEIVRLARERGLDLFAPGRTEMVRQAGHGGKGSMACAGDKSS